MENSDPGSEQFYKPVYIAGQTASGKTGVSIELANRLGNAEIVNCDAYQIYRGIEILAATPTIEERGDIPHHLFGHFSIDEECDAASFAAIAREKISEVAKLAVPIVVGGSGLYLKSVTHGIGPTPPADPVLREELETRTLEELVAEYEKLDPEGAAQTNLKNRRYVSRNLEICLITGKAASELKSQWENDAPDFNGIYLQREREEIYDRINRRTRLMFDQGAVREIAGLEKEPSTTAAKAIGIREIKSLIAGDISEEECIAAIQQITRRYAKRQETWFKREKSYVHIPCHEGDSASEIVDEIVKIFPVSELLYSK